MDRPFRGRFEGKIDPKGRLSLPKNLLASLPAEDSQVVITNSQFKGQSNLDVYPLAEWVKLEERIGKLPALKAEVQAFRRFYLASGQVVAPDGNNRILIPGTLRKYAGLNNEVVIVAMGNKFELWSADIWQQLFNQLASQFEDTINVVADLDQEKD